MNGANVVVLRREMFYFQVIKHVNTGIPASVVVLLLNPESAIMKLRFCADEEV